MTRSCKTLSDVLKTPVVFDASDPEHLRAFKMVCIGDGPLTPIRQHPTLRFHLEQPFTDVRAMMFHHVGEAYLQKTIPQECN